MNLFRTIFFLTLVGSVTAQVTTTGFDNAARTEAPGTLLSHPVTNGSEPIGRTTSINYLNGWIIVGAEAPGSREGSDLSLRVYDISDPANPVRRLPSDFGLSYPNNLWIQDNYGWNAHGTAQYGNLLLPAPIRVNGFGGLVELGGTNGIPNLGNLPLWYNRSSQAGPWEATLLWYGTPDSDIEISRLSVVNNFVNRRVLATFDHVGQYGGGDWHPMFFGDLLIMARSGPAGNDGIVVYRLSYNNMDDGDANNDSITPQPVGSLQGGFQGYWPNLFSDGTGLYVIGSTTNILIGADITSATMPGANVNLQTVASLTVPGFSNASYPAYQDNFGFIHNRKVDMTRFLAGDANPIVLTLNETNPPRQPGAPALPQGAITGVNTSQMSLPLGNLWLTGGYPIPGTNQGLGVWVHQQAPDTTPPRVSYHIPQNGRTNYPRHAPLSFLVHEHPHSGGPRNGIDFTVRAVGENDVLGAFVPGFLIHDFSGNMTFTPDVPLAADTTYQVDFLSNPALQIGFRDAAGNYIEPYHFRFSTGGGLNAPTPPVFTSLTASSYQPAPNQEITVTAAATGTGSLDYRFNFDGTWGAWSTSTSAIHTYTTAGRPRVLAQVRDAAGNIVNNSLRLLVITPPAGPMPTQSSTLAIGEDAGTRRVWSVNPDANTVTVIHAATGAKEGEYAVGVNPRSIARDVNGRYWVTCFASDEIRILNADGSPHQTLALEYGDGPFGIAPSPDGTLMYVTLSSAGRLHRYSVAAPGAPTHTAVNLITPRAIAISGDGSRVLVTRFISADMHAEVLEFTATLGSTRTFNLTSANTFDGGDRAAGVPNYLAGIAISPDGTRAAIVSKQDNTQRGTFFGVGNLTHETTSRAVISFLDLTGNFEIPHSRRDFDNSDSPSAVIYTPLGDTILVTHQGNNRIVGMDAFNLAPLAELIIQGSTITQPAVITLEVGTGLAPQGLLMDGTSGRLFAQNFMGRSVTVLNAAPLLTQNQTSLPLIATTSTVATELLTPTVLLGKQIFYNAADPRMSADSYISCATCHVDGGHDGRVWDFTGRGEGLRRTTDLRGRSGLGHGAVHWSGNFDEIQDFEHDIRGPFGGTGFLNLTPQQFTAQHPSPASGKTGLSGDLDALAAYVSSLTPDHTPRSPHRNADGTFTAAAVAGQAVFTAQNCASCHSGSSFTNSTLMNVGTQSALSGSRLGVVLPGIDTPTLHGLHATRVFLHHGQAASLDDVFSYAGGAMTPGASGQLIGAAFANADTPAEGGGGSERGMFGGAAVYLDPNSAASVRYNNVDGGSGGTARIAFRYVRNYNGGTANLIINGVSQSITVLRQFPDNGFQTSGWLWFVTTATLNAGATNTIEIERTQPSPHQINALLVANADVLAQAQPHRLVQSLSTTDQNNLLAYLTQLDGRDASGTPLPAPSAPSPQAPSIVSGPQSTVVAEGSTLSFVAVISGTGPFTFVWRRGSNVIGSNSAELQITNVSSADAGSYTVEVTNAHGSTTSTPAEVTVNPALAITTTTLPVATVGVPFSTGLSATGGISSRTWTVQSGLLPPGITLSTSGVLSGTATTPARALITVQVSDASGSDTQALTVNAAPVGGFVNDPDLILHYTFDEGSSTRVWDSASGGNNHTTDVSGAHWISDGRFGGAYGPASTDAGMQNFTPANQADLNLNPLADAFTVSLWCRTTATGYNTLFSKDGGDPYRIQHRLWIAPTQLQGINGNQYGGQIASVINDGQWHLVTMVNFNDAGTWRTRVYYDNGTQSTQFDTGNGGTVSELFRIGGLSAGWNGWIGQIDDLRIYRRALSQSEIAALHAAPDVETFAEWSAANLPVNPSLNGPTHDANGNGIPNLIEFIAPQPLSLQITGGNATLTLSRNTLARGVTLIVECSDDLTTWVPLATSINGTPPTGTATITEGSGVVRTLTVQHAASPNRSFYRVRAVMP
ncbi:MAG: immunoglobulin domain-containing protein [Verrucomicrobiaceae bacterium]|nr:immunoglobulin domain-containing protein [Verrucomicrobiaceae bacterium]